MAHSSWGPGYPNCQPDKIDRNFSVSGTKFPGGIRHELCDLVRMLVQECKNRGYQFGNSSDPSHGCWGFNCRAISGSNTPSNHSWGLAVDINAPSNPYTSPLVTDMPSWMPQLWESYRFRWGGNYSGRKDAMHYEFMGSINDAAIQTNKARAAGLGGIPPKPLPPKDWFDTVTKDEMMQLLAPMNAAITECQARLRGSDTGPGQRHEHFDMLQGIDSDTHDTQRRVRGMDTNAGQKHEHYDMLQGIDDALRAVKGYGDDPAQYPYAAAFKSLTDRVYELTIKED